MNTLCVYLYIFTFHRAGYGASCGGSFVAPSGKLVPFVGVAVSVVSVVVDQRVQVGSVLDFGARASVSSSLTMCSATATFELWAVLHNISKSCENSSCCPITRSACRRSKSLISRDWPPGA